METISTAPDQKQFCPHGNFKGQCDQCAGIDKESGAEEEVDAKALISKSVDHLEKLVSGERTVSTGNNKETLWAALSSVVIKNADHYLDVNDWRHNNDAIKSFGDNPGGYMQNVGEELIKIIASDLAVDSLLIDGHNPLTKNEMALLRRVAAEVAENMISSEVKINRNAQLRSGQGVAVEVEIPYEIESRDRKDDQGNPIVMRGSENRYIAGYYQNKYGDSPTSFFSEYDCESIVTEFARLLKEAGEKLPGIEALS